VAPGDAGWRAAPHCASEVDGLRIAFIVDDVDPFRDLRGYSAPLPLNQADLVRWQRLLDDAWAILVRHDRARAEAVAAALTSLVPLPAAKPYRPLSASCDEAFAVIIASMPDDAMQLAATLVHETQHVKLGALLHLVTFVDDPGGPPVYAPWRDDPRPLSGVLQGVYAFVGITDFWRRHRSPGAEFEFALWRIQITRVLAGLRDDSRLSPLGRELINNLAATASGWDDHPTPPEIMRLATSAARDHRAQWRALHVTAPAEWIAAATHAWAAGEPCPPIEDDAGIAPVTDTRARWLDGRAVLARIRLTDPEQFAILAKDPTEVTRQVPGTLPADVALISGDADAARDGYLRHLADDPADPRAWAGLGLALAALDRPAEHLLERPELIRALARNLPGVDALALTGWMAGARSAC